MADDSANDEIKFLRDRVRQLEDDLTSERRARAALDHALRAASEMTPEQILQQFLERKHD